MSNLLTQVDIVLDTLFPKSEAEILNQMISKFRSSYFEKYGVDATFFTASNINYIEMLAFASRQYDQYFMMKYVIKSLLLPTALNTYLDIWASIRGVERRTATQALGKVTFPTASVGVTLPAGTKLQATSLEEYTVDSDSTSQTYTYTVTAITQTDRTVRYTLALGEASSHGLYTGQVVTISGSTVDFYNGSKTITVISTDTIEFQIPFVSVPDTDLSPLQVTFVGIKADVHSVNYSEATNLTVGETLSLLSPVSGITEVGRVHLTGVLGGGSAETDDQFYARILLRFQKPFTRFNRTDVYDLLLSLDPSLQHYEVRQGYPNPGEALVYVGRNGASISQSQFSSEELLAFEAYLNDFTDIGVATSAISVENFDDTVIDVTLTGIAPNSSSMLAALQTSIEGYFEDLATGKDVSVDELRGIVATAVSTAGEVVTSYTLSAPASSVTIPEYGRAYLGNLTLSTV